MSDRVFINERAWQRTVLDCARAYGWFTAHFRPAQNAKGVWRTPVEGDAKGFPDLVLVRERVLFVELKTDKGRLTRHQQAWLDRLAAAGQATRVWRPSDWDEVEATLKRPLVLR